ncbi:hypothetical protein BRC81_11685 [Halobacteriales archaeon QS_1_68_20]|nr:MAG: hypothetical protein BRC81_11685 [Halobacteriales archaeon QS_1_68_20]
MGLRVRLVVLAALLLALAGLGVWFGSLPPVPEAGSYPDESLFLTDYDAAVGERVVFDGEVTGTDPVTVHVEAGSEATSVRLRGAEADVSPGDRVQVYGVVEPGGVVRALNVVPVSSWGMPYAVVVSALAGLWVLARLHRHWEVDAEGWCLRRTDRPDERGDRGA